LSDDGDEELEEGEQENVALAVFKSLGAIVNPEDPIFVPLKKIYTVLWHIPIPRKL
jgi:hypothetical protein